MKRISFLFLFLCALHAFSQTDSGDMEAYLNTIIANMPGDSGDDFKVPTSTELTSWENCINAILNGDITTARTHADAVNYRIVEYTNTGFGHNSGTYYIVEEKSSQTNYWGTYIFASGPTRELVIQAPHSDHDFNTGKQAVYSFVRLHNLALFLNGTHRCNHSQASSCSGTTSVCSGSSEPFKISDMAHTANAVWQKTTEVIYNTISESVFVQLHGFTKLSTDPYVILSNGTDQTPTTDYAVQFKDNLSGIDPSLTFKIAHIDNWTRLVGFTNTQGRFINQSSDPCSSAATSTTGRFLHVEQEKSKLRQDMNGWDKIYQALENTFIAAVSVEDHIKIHLKTENPFKNSIEFSADKVKKVLVYSILGERLYEKENTNKSTNFSIDTRMFTNGIYLLKVITENGVATLKLLHE